MERIKLAAAVAALMGVTAVGAQERAAGVDERDSAQRGPAAERSEGAAADSSRQAAPTSATALIGASVRDERGAEVGEVTDLLIEGSEIVGIELTVGGTLDTDEERLELPYSSLRVGDGGGFIVARSQLVLLTSSEAAGESRPSRRDENESRPAQGAAEGAAGSAEGPAAEARETVAPLDVDEDLAEIDPRLAEGIAASEEAYDEDIDEETFDNETGPSAENETDRAVESAAQRADEDVPTGAAEGGAAEVVERPDGAESPGDDDSDVVRR